MKASFLAVMLMPLAERGHHSTNSTVVVLENSQTETGFVKTNFLLMKGDNSIISFCLVLTFKSAEI